MPPVNIEVDLQGLDLGQHNVLPEGAELVPEEIELKLRDTGPAEILAEEMTSFAT